MLLCLCGLGHAALVRSPVPIPVVTIDLDTAPEHRWDVVMKNLVDTHGWNYTYQPVLDYIHKMVPPPLLALIDNLSMDVGASLPSEMYRELQGFEQLAIQFGHGSDLNFGVLLTLNLLYEYTTACTSIVAMDASNTTWHSRNLDWAFDGYSLRNVTVHANFQRNGQTVYSGITWAGYAGLLTGLRQGGFSITIDQRGNPDIFDIVQALLRIKDHKAVPVAYFLRDTLATKTNYPDALTALSKTEVSTSIYFILAGAQPMQGAVITRDEQHVAKDVWVIPNGPQPWYILETNYDHDTQPPQHDDRRDLAIHAMNALGQARVSADTLYQVMLTPAANHSKGVFNSDTQYTTIISPTTGYFTAWTWQ